MIEYMPMVGEPLTMTDVYRRTDTTPHRENDGEVL